MSGRFASLFLATGVGIVSGIYIFKPLLEQYKADTHGTFRPEQRSSSPLLQPDRPDEAGDARNAAAQEATAGTNAAPVNLQETSRTG
ncbi:hypothetical protein P389DRAFT_194464 [Cystobasidium minutum MCA 4210]|uniref:uncharacterized protein n=1 Tax=Cystobasidium minutum MCA 4210 TaxID=1397322 RepID=UPI0034CF4B9C|eukprot:jgi/Rhomi1/194464/gm1.2678_g